MSVESFVIFAIVIGHEILLHPIQLPYLAINTEDVQQFAFTSEAH